MSRAFVVQPGMGRLLNLQTFEAEVLASAEQTSGAFTVLRTKSEPADFGPPLHVHDDAAEAFLVLEGEYLMYIDEEQTVCPPGTFVYIPAGTPHTFKVVSSSAGMKLNIFSPAAMVGFFEDLAAAEAAGTPSPELLGKIADRNKMRVLGPVPENYL